MGVCVVAIKPGHTVMDIDDGHDDRNYLTDLTFYTSL